MWKGCFVWQPTQSVPTQTVAPWNPNRLSVLSGQSSPVQSSPQVDVKAHKPQFISVQARQT